MSTLLCTKAATTYPVPRPIGGGLVGFQSDTYNTSTTALVKDDIIAFFYLPPCDIVWGFLLTSDIDTDSSEALEVDIGIPSDTDVLIDSSVLVGDAITDLLPTHAATGDSCYRIFNGLNAGPVALTAETLIQGTVVAAATAGGTGTLYLGVFFTND